MRKAIDEDVGHLKPWLSWTLEEPATLERTQIRLRMWIDHFQRGMAFRYAITPGDRPALILGGVSLNTRAGPGAYELGYWVRKSAARQGIASAAAAALAVHAFDERGMERLVIRCDVANARSAALARTLGFRDIGGITTTYPDGTPRPMLQLEMTHEDYRLHHTVMLRDRAGRVYLRARGDGP